MGEHRGKLKEGCIGGCGENGYHVPELKVRKKGRGEGGREWAWESYLGRPGLLCMMDMNDVTMKHWLV